MAIKALFESGKTEITVSGLYQWDYGQVLEIESSDLGTEIIEVHFACTNMTEAIVRPCTLTNGVGSVTIPDDCLEQASTITAWVYTFDGVDGRNSTWGNTRKVIHFPVIARTRPSASRDIPQDVSDRYTELITEVNKAVNALESGNTVVAKANNATNADHAASAGNASTANYATSAGSAGTANVAKCVVTPDFSLLSGAFTFEVTVPGLYMVDFFLDSKGRTGLISIADLTAESYGPLFGLDDTDFYLTYQPSEGLYVGNGSSKCPLGTVTRLIAYPNE